MRISKMEWLYLFECHDSHQLPDAGDVGVTETQQGEQSVCLSNDREEDTIQALINMAVFTLHDWTATQFVYR